ncbi:MULTISPECIES: methylaspartate ammonia-lyase [Clostridium]|uniref:methylaspartate ammonia-lyase n=1 Tax=Clostridium cadaveris TaxID=1529 RepID=A0A1I2L6K5_9CLOT|nr:methylaspartate ammonia-lyase [Clostridium cadaveris]MDU4951572.1 methylaspartate ammonia-lyase [Clostridium sp.]MDM8312451.1 methylaspartate ammonia-lyase [Clostridium cadaveris]NME63593.1 methylaspartate ammonia-lyase [Clostridium cadaveris]NWK09867.1 methylaspartate ammonia-lyase [Clostridium cadaveris]PWL51500.1 MAG: methylaspartate ammonia-lyase [Clostridium cadaveris]
MKIVDVVCSAGRTGFYFDDQRAIKKGAGHDGFTYVGEPVTEGFTSIRQSGESISVQLILEDGQVALGDCAAVQYSGAGGRDPLFLAADFIPVIEKEIAPKLIGRELNSFKALAEEFDKMQVNGKRLHTAIRYGVTQAILDAVAKANHVTMAEIVRDEYNTGVEIKRIPIFTQSGDDRYDNSDKMIIKGADVMPHALINHVADKLGEHGEKLLEYVKWLRNRVIQLRTCECYSPVFHIDVYGTIGLAFDCDVNKMADYIMTLEEAAKPFHLRIEGPMDVEERQAQMEALRDLTAELAKRNSTVELVADEWCNTYDDVKFFADNKAGNMLQIKTPDLGGVNNIIESILYCKKMGVGAYCGGTCNETNRSAEVCTNIAIACGADQCLAKPGMGVDEGYMIVNNEMNRVVALVNRRK